jgi:hypothetical protein
VGLPPKEKLNKRKIQSTKALEIEKHVHKNVFSTLSNQK